MIALRPSIPVAGADHGDRDAMTRPRVTPDFPTERERLEWEVEEAQEALRIASGRNIKGERAQRRKELAMAVARLAAETPARRAA